MRTALTKARGERAREAGFAERAWRCARNGWRGWSGVAAGEDDRVLALTAQTELTAAERSWRTPGAGRKARLRRWPRRSGWGRRRCGGIVLARPRAAGWTAGGSAADAALSRSDVLRAVADYDLAENALRLEVAKQYPEVRIGPGYVRPRVNNLPFNPALVLPTYDLNQRHRPGGGRADGGRTRAGADPGQCPGRRRHRRRGWRPRGPMRERVAPASSRPRRTAANAARAVRAGEADRVDDCRQAAEADAELNLLDARRPPGSAAADLRCAAPVLRSGGDGRAAERPDRPGGTP